MDFRVNQSSGAMYNVQDFADNLHLKYLHVKSRKTEVKNLGKEFTIEEQGTTLNDFYHTLKQHFTTQGFSVLSSCTLIVSDRSSHQSNACRFRSGVFIPLSRS